MKWQRVLDQKDLGTYPNTTTLKDLISESEKQAETEACVVCRVEVNGLALTEEDEERLAGSNVKEILSFSAYGQTVTSLEADTVKSVVSFLPLLQRHALEISENLRTHGFGPGLPSMFAQLVDDLQTLNNYFQRRSSDAAQDYSRFHRLLTGLITAFGERDSVLLADLLEYELTACLNDWQHQVCGQ